MNGDIEIENQTMTTLQFTTRSLTNAEFNSVLIDTVSFFLSLLTAIVAIIGNGLVIYAAYGKKSLLRVKALRSLDIVIKSLAVTDLMVGLVGIPCRIIAIKLEDFSKSDINVGRIVGKYCVR